jgi:hypothetical protein
VQCATRADGVRGTVFSPLNEESDMKIMLINNDGGGFADHVEVSDGISVAQLFRQQLPSKKPTDYLIRINRLPTSSDQVIQPGDRVSITPTKIEGAGTSQSSSSMLSI